jgi:PAS domain-containing protein
MRSIDPSLNLIGRRKDGTRFPIEFKSFSMETATGPAVLIIVRDATERMVAPADRRQNDQQFRSVVEAVLDYAIFLLDPEGLVKTWNSGAARIEGYTAEDVLGAHFSRFFAEEDLQGCFIRLLSMDVLKTKDGGSAKTEQGFGPTAP